MAKGKWLFAAVVAAAAAGAVYVMKKVKEEEAKIQTEMDQKADAHKEMVKKGNRTVVLPEGDVFQGGSVGVLCGNLKYDMSRAEIEEGAELNVKVCMGAATVQVPENTNLVVNKNGAKSLVVKAPADVFVQEPCDCCCEAEDAEAPAEECCCDAPATEAAEVVEECCCSEECCCEDCCCEPVYDGPALIINAAGSLGCLIIQRKNPADDDDLADALEELEELEEESACCEANEVAEDPVIAPETAEEAAE